jgi:hypothetical protein
MLAVYILFGAITGLLGGWITGAVLYKSFSSALLRMIAFPLAIGSATAVAGYLWLGFNGVFGLLAIVPAAIIALIWIRCIEPKVFPGRGNPEPNTIREERELADGETQIPCAVVGTIFGAAFAGVGYASFGDVGGLIAAIIVAPAFVFLLYGGIVCTLLMVVETCMYVGPIIGAFLIALWYGFVRFLHRLGDLLSDFMYRLTGIGERIGTAINEEDKRLEGE